MNYRFWWWFHWCQGCFFWDLSANLQPLSIWTGNILRQCLLSWSVCFTYFSYTIWFQPKIGRMWSRWLRYILYMHYERGLKQAHEGSDHPSFMLIVRAFSATRKNRAYTTDEYKEVCLRRLEMIFQHCWNRSGGLLLHIEVPSTFWGVKWLGWSWANLPKTIDGPPWWIILTQPMTNLWKLLGMTYFLRRKKNRLSTFHVIVRNGSVSHPFNQRRYQTNGTPSHDDFQTLWIWFFPGLIR